MVCFLESGCLKNRQRAKPDVMRGHSCTQVALCTRLSPEEGNKGRDLHAPALVLPNSFVREGSGRCSPHGAGWLHRRSFCGRTLPLLSRGFWLNVFDRIHFECAPPSQVQWVMRHKHFGTTEHYVREAQQMLKGAEGRLRSSNPAGGSHSVKVIPDPGLRDIESGPDRR